VSTDVYGYEDPGWRRAFRLGALPWGPLRTGQEQLSGLRVLLLAYLATLPLFFLAFSFFTPWDSGYRGRLWIAVVALGVFHLWRVRATRNRRLWGDSEERIVAWYKARFFNGMGLSMAPFLFAVVFVFFTGSLLIMLVALPFTLLGLAWCAPTRADIERRQKQLVERGFTFSLGRALVGQPQAT
jgi:hypothetical protein